MDVTDVKEARTLASLDVVGALFPVSWDCEVCSALIISIDCYNVMFVRNF